MVLQDEKLLAKLSAGDLVALEAKYHAPCLASLYKKAERVKEEGEEDETSPRLPEGIALAELVSFIEESRMVSTAELPVFRLAELVDKYTSRLKQLGENTPARIHTTRLKTAFFHKFQLSKNTSKDVMYFWPSKRILPTHYRKLIRKTVMKKRCTLPKPQ